MPDLDHAPPVEAAGIFPQSLWHHSYIRLSDEQFETARGLIETAARRVPDRPQDVVARGYDAGADRFAAWKMKIVDMSGPVRARRLLTLLLRVLAHTPAR